VHDVHVSLYYRDCELSVTAEFHMSDGVSTEKSAICEIVVDACSIKRMLLATKVALTSIDYNIHRSNFQ